MERDKVTDIPPELSMCLPRAVRLSGIGKAVAAASIVLAAGGIVVPALLWLDRENKADLRARIEREGVAVEAEVTRTGMTGGDDSRPFADYRYTYGAGRVVLQHRDPQTLAPGDHVQVRYLPGEPGRSWAVGHEPHGAPLAVLPVPAASFFLGAVVIAVAVRRQWRLLAEGRATMSRILAVKRTRDSEGGTHYRAQYEIVLPSGAVRQIWARGSKRFVVDSRVPVVYDPENPKRLSRYPLPLVCVARD
ncbi:MAG TPA: DUF3592 domain-containing protein [Bryobacteraceae bacterium]|nr:DUF3592 domain-containing protein [Bryobacteraceae bacterium]